MRNLFLLFFLFLTVSTKIIAQDSDNQDYVVLLTGEIQYGRISYAPGDKVSFKAEGEKKVKAYYPMQISGYFYKGVYHRSKFSPRLERNLFMPSYRSGDDKDTFKKITKLEIKTDGKIKLYHGFMQGLGNPMYGSNRVEILELDIEDNPLYIEDITVNILADAVKANKELHNQVLGHEGRLKLEKIEHIITEYNKWHALNHKAY